MKPALALGAALLCSVGLLSTTAHAQTPRPDGTVPNEVIFQVQPDANLSALAAAYQLTLIDQFGTRAHLARAGSARRHGQGRGQ